MASSGRSPANDMRRIYAFALALVVCAYSLALASSFDLGFSVWFRSLVANVTSLAVCGVIARQFVLRLAQQRDGWMQAVLHILGCAVFSLGWFFALMVSLGVSGGDSWFRFSVEPFLGPAAFWQLMQGASFYAVIALLAEVETLRKDRSEILSQRQTDDEIPQQSENTEEREGSRIFVRDGDEIRPLETDRIIRVSGARDYAEVVTRTGTHLLRTSLAELEQKLGGDFLRVHRSSIVNIDQIDRVEPAGGGRLHLHMLNGDTVNASRAGAKRIRERTV